MGYVHRLVAPSASSRAQHLGPFGAGADASAPNRPSATNQTTKPTGISSFGKAGAFTTISRASAMDLPASSVPWARRVSDVAAGQVAPRLFGGSCALRGWWAPQFGGVVDQGGAPAGMLYVQLISALMDAAARFSLDLFCFRSSRKSVGLAIVAIPLSLNQFVGLPSALQCA